MEKLNFISIEAGASANGYALITDITEKTTKTGKPYVEITMSDGQTTVVAKKWDTKKEEIQSFEKKAAIVMLSCKDYNGNKDFLVNDLAEPASGIDITDFIKKAPLDPGFMYSDILDNVKSTVKGDIHGTLAGLTVSLYEKNKDLLMTHGAASGVHHNYYAGLLYHTYRMVRSAKALLSVYSSLDGELLLSAAALHDIGKLKELDTDEFGVSSYSIDGQLFGHAVLGIEMIDEEAGTNCYPEDRIRCLKHCIAAHHGKLEWGASALPHIEEAAVLHEIDMIDSRVEIFEKAAEAIEPGEISDTRINSLGGIRPYLPEKPMIKKEG